jgi:Cu(I)/Ag(I) efflux system periplasmic protein CusF
MTMVFGVKDKAMLKKVKLGDQVNFVAEMVNGLPTVTKIEQAK